MKHLLLLGGLSLAALSNAQVFSQTNLINATHNQGVSSMLEAGDTIIGFSVTPISPSVLADDFTLATDTNLTMLRLFAYQTGATTESLSTVSFAISSSATLALNAGTVVSTGWYDVSGQRVYRTQEGDVSSTNRRIQYIDVALNQSLTAGTYVVSYQLTGSSNSVFVPPIPNSQAVGGKNGLQSTGGNSFVSGQNGLNGVDLPFELYGQPVPEPGTMIALGLPALVALKRRKRSA